MLNYSKPCWSWLLAVGIALLVQGCATGYSAPGLTMQIVDSQSKKPLAGVNVVAHWKVKYGLEGTVGQDVMLLETKTDVNGRFVFPAWQKEAPADLPWGARPSKSGPEIILFSSGYRWRAFSNQNPRSAGARYTFISEWDGKTTELTRLSDNEPNLRNAMSGVLTGVSLGGCNFKKIPMMLTALASENRRLKLMGVSADLPDRQEYEARAERYQCGSVDYIFGEK